VALADLVDLVLKVLGGRAGRNILELDGQRRDA
jgi:hypothetical protein